MDAKYINPFLTTCATVLNKISKIEVNRGVPYTKNTPYATNKIIIIIGITGSVYGKVVFGMSEETAKKIASAMMLGMNVEHLDEMAKSALSELGNIIMGNVCTVFEKSGMIVDITPPTFLIGDNMSIFNVKTTTICIPLILEGCGTVEVDASLAEAK